MRVVFRVVVLFESLVEGGFMFELFIGFGWDLGFFRLWVRGFF